MRALVGDDVVLKREPRPKNETAWKVRVDTGGTFTDGWSRSPEGVEKRCKVLSSGILRTRVVGVLGDGCYRLAGDFGAADGVGMAASASANSTTVSLSE